MQYQNARPRKTISETIFKRIKMPNYDEIVLGVGNPLHPANQREQDTELTYEQSLLNQIETLEEMLKNRNEIIQFRIKQLNEIKELCEGMSDNNGLAILILNKLK